MARISRSLKNFAIPATVIIATISITVGMSVASMASLVVKNENSVVSLVSAQVDAYTCEQMQPTIPVKGGRYAVLRLDDIQDSGWDDLAIQMMRDAFDRDAPVSAGVIPNEILDDDKITTFLRSNHCRIEIAQHGFDHLNVPNAPGDDTESATHPEFSELNKDEARKRIDDGRALLRQLLPEGQDVTTFIPPENMISDAGKEALHEAGFRILSAEGSAPMDYSASTYDFYEKKLVSLDTVLGKCSEDLDREGVCVIMLHPQDYANEEGFLDPDKYQKYLELLDGLQAKDVQFVTFSELSKTRQYPY